ncbi:SAM-dependent methyltransferase [Burkholderia gladioli]|uniref:Class I SAM-dependent methyltransferase n=1 Tax=Burkholderia gladioli TaxID=28095 RepID=A0A2A7SJA9_BURGA|nr:class I SAM-dependent methyltransferase [Burkholderia gladioli]ATF88740.1 SAM-dependent methyltransferase [Burkholderia gladioli pv. gladioli]MBU9170209.1 class I SAM-dependent methyltransferase [Burkholderia gladioli]MBU9193880.1 class I SAM-dependent methyltransferase [Burkholderia gladioli]MBU9426523.1 class I SAM-dependent methyltransferase [Burkholderia gladioli]MDN7806492.1 class I SAM-dependent methyltransferase [Burkholderia gladioli]
MTATTFDSKSVTDTDGWFIRYCERGRISDSVIRGGISALLWQKLRAEHVDDDVARIDALNAFVEELNRAPLIADAQTTSRELHDMPASFFEAYLGPRMKQSCCYFPQGEDTLAHAEDAMLELYGERAELVDGQRILDIGCGWGAQSLWLAEHYRQSQVVGLTNSARQREFIEQRAAARGITNLKIVIGDVATYEFAAGDAGFDRVLSIENFEHMKNYRALLAKISHWMSDDGKLFVHLFAHRLIAYHFTAQDGNDWMSRHFFGGGTMPSADLLLRFQDHLRVEKQWWLDGTHYQRTANHWLASLDAAHEQVMPILRETFGEDDAPIVFQRWRMFYMAVAGLFGYRHGREWGVAHYLFDKRSASGAQA